MLGIGISHAGVVVMTLAAVTLIASARGASAKEAPLTPHIQKAPFGQTASGEAVQIYTLTNKHGIEARIMTYGGTIVSLKTPDRNGQLEDIVLGFDTLDPYLAGVPYFGAPSGVTATASPTAVSFWTASPINCPRTTAQTVCMAGITTLSFLPHTFPSPSTITLPGRRPCDLFLLQDFWLGVFSPARWPKRLRHILSRDITCHTSLHGTTIHLICRGSGESMTSTQAWI